MERRPPANRTHRHVFLFLWSVPWPDDLNIRIWPRSIPKIYSIPKMNFLGPGLQNLEHYRQTDIQMWPKTLPCSIRFTCTVWVKKVAPNTFCNIFGQAISMKFCQYIISLYACIYTNFGRFILIFNKMALIFLGILIDVSSFHFTKSNCRDCVANDESSPIPPTSNHWIIRIEGNAGVLLQAATKAKTVPKCQVYRSTLA